MDNPDKDQIFRNAISQYRAYEEMRWRDARRGADAWQVEAIRHLALLEGAALAGTVALLATNRYGASLLLPLVLFLMSFVVLVYGMHVATLGFTELADDYVERIRKIDNEQSKGDMEAALIFSARTTKTASLAGQPTLRIARRYAWISVGIFALGALSLPIILLCRVTG